MADLGKIAITLEGEYNSNTSYNKLDVVSANGGSYSSKINNNTEPLTNTDAWQKLVEKGATGAPGIDGANVLGITDKATTTTTPTPWSPGNPNLFEIYAVTSSGTYTNFVQSNSTPVTVSSGDLANNIVQIWVRNGVSEKVMNPILQPTQFIPEFVSSNFPLTSTSQLPVQRLYNNSIWQLQIGETSASTDIPGTSSKWVYIGDGRGQIYNKLGIPDYKNYYTLTNILNNNNFVTLWGGSNYISGGVSNNVYTWTATAANGRVESIFPSTVGDKFYIKIDVKATSNLVRIGVPGASASNVFHSGSGNFERLSTVFTGVTAGNLGLRVTDTRTSGFDVIQIKKAVVVNLTQIFGAGKEPTKSQFESMISSLPDYHFLTSTVIEDSSLHDGESYIIKNGLVNFYKPANLSGKNYVFFGDSITEFQNLPELVAKITGATVYDVSVGGTRLNRHGSVPNYDDLSFIAYVEAMSSGDWSAQDLAIQNLINQGDNNTVNYNTLRSIDWNTIDGIFFMYGTNDYDTPNLVLGSDSDTNTYRNISGAMNRIMTLLSTNFPHINIYGASPIFKPNNGGITNSDETPAANGLYLYQVGDKIIHMAKLYHAKMLDLYWECGINKFNYPIYITDGTHPNALGTEKIANRIARFLLSN